MGTFRADPPREKSPAAKSEEKRMFPQATSIKKKNKQTNIVFSRFFSPDLAFYGQIWLFCAGSFPLNFLTSQNMLMF